MISTFWIGNVVFRNCWLGDNYILGDIGVIFASFHILQFLKYRSYFVGNWVLCLHCWVYKDQFLK